MVLHKRVGHWAEVVEFTGVLGSTLPDGNVRRATAAAALASSC